MSWSNPITNKKKYILLKRIIIILLLVNHLNISEKYRGVTLNYNVHPQQCLHGRTFLTQQTIFQSTLQRPSLIQVFPSF